MNIGGRVVLHPKIHALSWLNSETPAGMSKELKLKIIRSFLTNPTLTPRITTQPVAVDEHGCTNPLP